MSLIMEYFGSALQHQKITPGDVITSLSKYCYEYLRHRLDFDEGDSEIVVGDWIVGADSGAVAKVVEVHADTTSWTNNTGYLILDSWSGTAFTNDEELKVAAGATMANVNGVIKSLQDDYPNKGNEAKAMLIVVYANTALVGITGGKPDQTALIGIPMVANSSMLLKDINSIRNFKAVDYTSGSASIVQLTFFF